LQEGVRRVASRWIDNSRWLFVAISVVGIGYVFVGAWLVTAGPVDPVAHTAAFLKHLVSPWMMATYVVALSLIGYGAWYLHSAPKRAVASADIESPLKRQTLRLVIAWLLVSASLAAIGFLYIRDLENTSQSERSSQQEAVARLKAQQIDKWLLERWIDAQLLATSLRGLSLDRLPADRDAEQTVQLLFAEALAGNTERTGISLIGPDGKVLAQAGEDSAPDKETTQAAMGVAANPAERRKGIVDVHLDGTPPQPRMVFLVPITARPGNGPTTAVLAMTVNPFQGLLPQITAWPTPSLSSEAVVVRREGDDVVFLISPSFLKPARAPLSFRVPLAGSTMPAAAAARQGDGVHIGPDYRGVEVLAASRRVSGVPWIVVAKTDLEEITRPLLRKELTLIAVIGAALVLAATMLIVLWRGEYAGLLAIRSQLHEEQAALTQHFARLSQLARDAFLLLAPDGRIIDANEAAVAIYGYSAEGLRNKNIRDLQLPEKLEDFDTRWKAATSNESFQFETVHRRKDGTILPVEVNTAAIDVDGKIYHQAFSRDVTRRKALEREVARLLAENKALLAATIVPVQVDAATIDVDGKINR
jgi:PAS domain S-box-containing protein